MLKPWGKTVDDLPVVMDYRLAVAPCVICGRPGTEVNHWMPQMLADDPEVKPEWDKWAQLNAPLCVTHHRLWHKKVTPWMHGFGRNGNHD